jgi:hypothetical protein
MVFGQGALFGQRLQRGETATAGLDFELAALGLTNDKVLQQAARSNVWRSASTSLDLRTLRGLGTSFFKGIDWIMGVLLME